MPLKDKEKQREQARLRKQRQRDKERDIGERDINSVTEMGVTRIEFIKEALRIKDKDGQVLNEDLIDGIEAASLRFNDREARYEKAYRYNQWRSGKEIAPAIPYALVYDRDKLEKVYESLKAFRQEENVYYGYPGLGGMPFDKVGECLEATL